MINTSNINDKLESLSTEERELALQILKEYSNDGSSSSMINLMQEDWDEIPVDIDTFLTDKRYLGNALIDNDGRETIFPY